MPDDVLHFTAPAKMNLMLHVTGRRPDGMHLLESVFILIDLADDVAVRPLPTAEIVRTGDVVGDVQKDLCVRAARLLQAECGCRLGAAIDVNKHIPAGAGLGGGSSDCALVLMALNDLWGLGLTTGDLMALGNRLGADVPFFIFGRSAFARGTGDELQPLDVPPTVWALAMPPTGTPTAAVFADPCLTRNTKSLTIAHLCDRLARDWPELPGRNDLQPVAVRLNPEIGRVLQALGPGARMTGSGSAVFAACRDQAQARARLAGLPAGTRGWVVRSLDAHPFALQSAKQQRRSIG